ncbi:hypothetical protein [Rhizobium sp. ICMP 5592]|uniref:hypothetical protein n=1 Tax=Rhizobium sp. ICMP 5592 TaxID=2292445 RepID=UPI001297C1E2|nr:hypothetical protein [Rhizobium sp. ICMP 5592]
MKLNRNLYNAIPNRRLLKLAITALGTLAISVTLLSSANAADLKRPEKKTIELYMKKYERNHTFFYTGNPHAGKVNVSAEEYFKGAPYICTPSGFGRTSHCYARRAY